MEHTFMTIHNLTPDANILFASDSIVDILGYQPDEVHGKSCFDYFHPDEVPFARSVHSRGVLLDKAAVLHYARILSRDGRWVSCECCFTVVHDVLVACTSIYRRGEKSERRAMEAPQIRRIFSCSPRDPRYHMLEHLSPKFKMPPMEREPRAALILNRFTRNLNIMFATNAVSSILGLRPDQVKNKSFYRCIQENCLPEAIECLESAKANDSIAYLRFSFRDPREPDELEDEEMQDEEEEGRASSSDSEEGGAQLQRGDMDVDHDDSGNIHIKAEPGVGMVGSSTGPSSASTTTTAPTTASGSESLVPQRPSRAASEQRRRRGPLPSIELEAVVSCTSDGLVVVLRKARPPIPAPHPPLLPLDFANGLFAAPWGQQPIAPFIPPDMLYNFRPPFLPQHMPLRENIRAAGGPPLDQLMRSIRDVAVFAWALVGINGNFATHSRGVPRDEAQPPDGLPVWDPDAGNQPYLGPENQAVRRWEELDERSAARAHGQPYPPVMESYHRPSPSMGSYAAPPPVWPGPPTAPYPPTYTQAQHHHVHFHHHHQPQPLQQAPSLGSIPPDHHTAGSAAPPYSPHVAATTQAGKSDDSMGGPHYTWQ